AVLAGRLIEHRVAERLERAQPGGEQLLGLALTQPPPREHPAEPERLGLATAARRILGPSLAHVECRPEQGPLANQRDPGVAVRPAGVGQDQRVAAGFAPAGHGCASVPWICVNTSTNSRKSGSQGAVAGHASCRTPSEPSRAPKTRT